VAPNQIENKKGDSMTISRYSMTPQKIQKWIKQGRGTGDLQDYKPWLTIRDVPSNGWRTRIDGLVADRKHHMLSDGETNLFKLLDLSPNTKDLKEQYPLLPLEATLAIAKSLGIKHPTDPITKEFIVITIDLLWCTKSGEQNPIDVKPRDKLLNPRIIEKFEIGRVFLKIQNQLWRLSTELEIPEELLNNCIRFHDVIYLDGFKLRVRDVEKAAQLLTEQVLQREKPLRMIASDLDDTLGLRAGVSLKIATHLMARRYWQVDWYAIQGPEATIDLKGINANYDFSNSFKYQSKQVNPND
jgi:TnsA endonuclease N terminal/TnsA endonuclease C terminal